MNMLIITGSAKETRNEINRFILNLTPPTFEFMAAGLDAVDKYLWSLKFVVTYHPDEIGKIKERRTAYGGNLDYLLISHKEGAGVDIVEEHIAPTGSSALLGVRYAIRAGYEKIILCGCPLENESENKKYDNFRVGWESCKDLVAGKVKSMSGWTRDFLGAPTEEWKTGGQ